MVSFNHQVVWLVLTIKLYGSFNHQALRLVVEISLHSVFIAGNGEIDFDEFLTMMSRKIKVTFVSLFSQLISPSSLWLQIRPFYDKGCIANYGECTMCCLELETVFLYSMRTLIEWEIHLHLLHNCL